jgi:hypothetical protein
MAADDLNQMARWLDLTEQQFHILLSIYRLESRREDTSPKSIEREYLKSYGRAPQKSNLFAQMRRLIGRKLIVKTGAGHYSVNFDSIDAVLQAKRDRFLAELDEFNRAAEKVREYFNKAALQASRPKVTYLDYDELYAALGAALKSADRFYATANFPIIAYTYPLATGIGTGDYLDVLWERCFKKKTLSCCYLTTLDIDFPFNHAFRVYGDPKKAYNECRIIIDQLWSQIATYDNLDVRYLKEPHGMDVLIPEKLNPQEVFLYTRDEHRNVIGGIEIRSPETALSAKHMFLRDFEYAEQLRGQKGEEIIENLKRDLEQKYSICKV